MLRITRLPAIYFATASALAFAVVMPSTRAVADSDEGVIHTHYDGVTNDLLTAGLGKSGLGAATQPTFANPLNPTTEELRRSAIYNNYRALVDPTAGGGYGLLYGPNVKADGTVTTSEGLIAGDEYIAFEKHAGGRTRVTMMVQVPDSFSPTAACIIAAPSSGSRGVYGAIATAGEWGLKHGCAVAYTDKGTGTGADDLQNNTVDLILLRSDQRPAPRQLQSVPRLQRAVDSAASLLHPGNGPDVRPLAERTGAAAEPGRAHDAARCGRAADHAHQRAADRGRPGGQCADHLRRRPSEDSGLRIPD
ncbi:3-hydroxybutyrate oligomer hydrolase family protein [Bradyrhizobium erythrophlei]|jgi:hypothetical protein|uniref:3HB-oligomer hydrolase (3HBOH) n=1 Tax=Bradyrhizobium erythrophlei TaxID=1437360 RepID=A0A1M7UF53_9BRAD|nr:3-hydroxybutyrate oligomer hydrolase family protein [Bradyrhizobium erythrophlei]SHN81649.1 3HB-oligomer hydrolase (3HBOH) [Bradyrhizobium erythrophlei]